MLAQLDYFVKLDLAAAVNKQTRAHQTVDSVPELDGQLSRSFLWALIYKLIKVPKYRGNDKVR